MKKKQPIITILVALLMVLPLFGNSFAQTLKGTIRIDGSTTVFPITEAVAEDLEKNIEEFELLWAFQGLVGDSRSFL